MGTAHWRAAGAIERPHRPGRTAPAVLAYLLLVPICAVRVAAQPSEPALSLPSPHD